MADRVVQFLRPQALAGDAQRDAGRDTSRESDMASRGIGNAEVVGMPYQTWQHKCGSQQFRLRRGGSIACEGCRELVTDLVWGHR
jgi:hypothetical protein